MASEYKDCYTNLIFLFKLCVFVHDVYYNVYIVKRYEKLKSDGRYSQNKTQPTGIAYMYTEKYTKLLLLEYRECDPYVI